MSEMVKKARKYEMEESMKIAKENRPVYHFLNPVGWMNDPNGFSDYKEEHHLFFQYYPYATHWDSMHWGHAKSADFIKWEYLPVALASDQDYDNFGVFSGSAIEDGEKQILIYTGVKEKVIENGKKCIRQNQCVAIGNGVEYEKIKNNPVVTADMLPEGSSLEDFRDPKVWKEGDLWYVVIGTTKNNEGRVLLYSSPDLREWEFVSVLAESHGELGSMWECPDFFRVGDKHVLMFSPIGLGTTITMYLIGDMDYSTGKFTWTEKGKVDSGCDFYAPQSLLDDKGRRIIIGWANSWPWMEWFSDFGPNMEDKWNGAMSLPREVKLDEKTGKLKFIPVEEIKNS